MLLAVHYRVMEHLGSLKSAQEARVALQTSRITRYIITQVILLFSLVLAYDLLDD